MSWTHIGYSLSTAPGSQIKNQYCHTRCTISDGGKLFCRLGSSCIFCANKLSLVFV
uniref:Uncharacterized protein n=1 Tax=Anguilla anguilla TaxID=7936 RepID=A0A0E9SEU1_ANGAN